MKRIKLIDFPFRDEATEPNITIEIKSPEPEVKEVSDDDLIIAIKELVKNSPMKILSSEKTMELLAQHDILVMREKVLELVKAHNDIFRTFNSQNNDVLITFAYKK